VTSSIPKNWRTPTIILCAAALALTIALGTRHSFGLFLQPITADLEWSRETFSFAIALQNLVYGIAQPFTGMIADKFGAGRVMAGGALLYALGLLLMANPGSGWEFTLSAGLLLGVALSCSGFSIVYGVIGRAFPPEKRSVALGIAGAAGSFGQFVMLPYGQTLITHIGWQNALMTLALTVLLVIPLSRRSSRTPAGRGRHSNSRFRKHCAKPCSPRLLALCIATRSAVSSSCSFRFTSGVPVDQHMTPETGMIALA
jgi:MFS family permease